MSDEQQAAGEEGVGCATDGASGGCLRHHRPNPTPTASPTPQRAASFYKRVLPQPSVGFSTPQGREIFREALAAGTMEVYFRLAEQFTTQAEPAYCGLASLVMVLNAFEMDPLRTWKGVWRWYDESLLDCCVPLATVQTGGITMAEWLCLAQCQGLEVHLHRFGSFSIDDFRAVLTRTCSGDLSFVVVSYSRKVLGQTGDGHFSPVGGYNAAKDMVLLLDVARFKYPPHWVPTEVLFAAMELPDSSTQQPRGFFTVQRAPSSSVLFTIGVDFAGGEEAVSSLAELIEKAHRMLPSCGGLCSRNPGSKQQNCCATEIPSELPALLISLPLKSILTILQLRGPEFCPGKGSGWTMRKTQFLSQLHALPVFQLVAKCLEQHPTVQESLPTGLKYTTERVVFLVLLASMCKSGSAKGCGWTSSVIDISDSSNQLVATEALFLLRQLIALCQRYNVPLPPSLQCTYHSCGQA